MSNPYCHLYIHGGGGGVNTSPLGNFVSGHTAPSGTYASGHIPLTSSSGLSSRKCESHMNSKVDKRGSVTYTLQDHPDLPVHDTQCYASEYARNLSNVHPFTKVLSVVRDVIFGDLSEGVKTSIFVLHRASLQRVLWLHGIDIAGNNIHACRLMYMTHLMMGACVSSAKCGDALNRDYSGCNIIRGTYTTSEGFVVDLIDVVLSHCTQADIFPYDQLVLILDSVGFDA